MLEIDDISFSYKNGQLILSNLSFEVGPGEILGIVGPNGTGKTTLLKTVNRLLIPQSGLITYDGQDMARLPLKALARLMAYVPQATDGFFSLKVIDCVMMGRLPYLRRGYAKKDLDQVFAILEKLEIQELAFRDINKISGGQRQLVYIARAMAQQPKIIILDEPTASLDIKNQLFILKVITELSRNEHYSVIMSLHDLNLASMFCDRVLILFGSRILAQGDPRDVLTEEIISRIYGIKTRISLEDGYKHVRLLK
ncbi:MAG: ABC transporter ATP-binding protein [Deltaproteobacteria bacterium]|jgi:iron complex transport system ATP-binding protein|nr:ABC transporter ATP-binding protein [Deltaproteobacteria bacterium]